MGIDVVWLDAAGMQRDLVPDRSSMLSKAIERVREGPLRQQFLISRIDPYADTQFSSGQAPRLLREFAALRDASDDPEERIAIGHVLSLLRAIEGAEDEWLEFLGD